MYACIIYMKTHNIYVYLELTIVKLSNLETYIVQYGYLILCIYFMDILIN